MVGQCGGSIRWPAFSKSRFITGYSKLLSPSCVATSFGTILGSYPYCDFCIREATQQELDGFSSGNTEWLNADEYEQIVPSHRVKADVANCCSAACRLNLPTARYSLDLGAVPSFIQRFICTILGMMVKTHTVCTIGARTLGFRVMCATK